MGCQVHTFGKKKKNEGRQGKTQGLERGPDLKIRRNTMYIDDLHNSTKINAGPVYVCHPNGQHY